MKEALAAWKTPCNLSVVENGDEALHFLRRSGTHHFAPLPNLILLDLNLPKKSGVVVLEEIKKVDALARIPVIVLTTSDRETDVRKAYSLHANCYLTKPLDINEFIDKIKAIEQFWLHYARLPRNSF